MRIFFFCHCGWSDVCYTEQVRLSPWFLKDPCYPLISKLCILSWAWSGSDVICPDYKITLFSPFLWFTLEGIRDWHSEAWHACFTSWRAQHPHKLFKIFLHEEIVYSISFTHLFIHFYQHGFTDINFIFCEKKKPHRTWSNGSINSTWELFQLVHVLLWHASNTLSVYLSCCTFWNYNLFQAYFKNFWPSSRTFHWFKEL